MENALISNHARKQMLRREITEQQVRAVLHQREETIAVSPGRVVVQAVIPMGQSQANYLVRVVVDIDQTPPVVVTVYRTSKIEKYGRQQ
jgi:hypothetical protein